MIELDGKYKAMLQQSNANVYPRGDFGPNGEFALEGSRWTFARDGGAKHKVKIDFSGDVPGQVRIDGQSCTEDCEIELEFGRIYPIETDSEHIIRTTASSQNGRFNLPLEPLVYSADGNDRWLIAGAPWNMTVHVEVRPNQLRNPSMLHDIQSDGIVAGSVLRDSGEQIVAISQGLKTCGSSAQSALILKIDASGNELARHCIPDVDISDLRQVNDGIIAHLSSTFLNLPMGGNARDGWVLLDDTTLVPKQFGWSLQPQDSYYGVAVKDGKLGVLKQSSADRLNKMIVFADDGSIESDIDLGAFALAAGGASRRSLSVIGNHWLYTSSTGNVNAIDDSGNVIWTLPANVQSADSIDGRIHAVGKAGTVDGESFAGW